ncbi:MAG TPA: hypothetical protein VIP46_03250 [Pyrinomonadaceae bacterium]
MGTVRPPFCAVQRASPELWREAERLASAEEVEGGAVRRVERRG